jgi:hypothetical protein
MATAREIATAVIAENASQDHLDQVGYALDLSDDGPFWVVQDGPNPVIEPDTITLQAGGSSIEFRIAKCTGAVSDFGRRSWR